MRLTSEEKAKRGQFEYLYYIDTKIEYNKKDEKGEYLKEDYCISVPIIKETRCSYYVPKNEFYKTVEEYGIRFGILDKEKQCYLVSDFSNCYIVNKKTMKAKISNIGDTHRTYYQHPFLAKESYFISQNAHKIAQALRLSNNPFLLRQIAHNLEVEDLVELKYDFETIKEGEN